MTDYITDEMANCGQCTQYKNLDEFPMTRLSKDCKHRPTWCFECIHESVSFQVKENGAYQPMCPECFVLLDYATVARYGQGALNNRFQRRTLEYFLSKVATYVWCPLGCEKGVDHPAGYEKPQIYCPECKATFCYTHQCLWHEDMTCEEQDEQITKFREMRTKIEARREQNKANDTSFIKYRQQADEAEAKFAQNLLTASGAAHINRIAELRREEVLEDSRLTKEEEATQRLIRALTRPCPGCKIPMEKYEDDCDDVTCLICGEQFNWDEAEW